MGTEGAETFLDALADALGRAAAFNPRAEVAPVALLWPDEAGVWGPLLPRLRARRSVFALGRYAPTAGTGGATWLRCVVERAVPESPPAGVVPVLHLPGYPARMLLDPADGGPVRSPADHPPGDLALLSDLRHRGVVWARPRGRDWTVAAFLEQAGVEVRADAATVGALRRALPLLATVPLARLRAEAPWRAADFDALAGLPAAAREPTVAELIAAGESAALEFKSTIRWDVHQGKANKALEFAILKTVAAFLNSEGGTLLIGVADDGAVLGLERDQTLICKKPRDWDRLELHVVGLFRNHFGNVLLPYLRVGFLEVGGLDVCRIVVAPAPEPAYVTENKTEQFYVRTGNGTSQLGMREAFAYIRHRWPTGN